MLTLLSQGSPIGTAWKAAMAGSAGGYGRGAAGGHWAVADHQGRPHRRRQSLSLSFAALRLLRLNVIGPL